MSHDIFQPSRAFFILDNLAYETSEKHPAFRNLSLEETLKVALDVDLTSEQDRTEAFLKYICPVLDSYRAVAIYEAKTCEEVYAIRKRFTMLTRASIAVLTPLHDMNAYDKMVVYQSFEDEIEHVYKGWKAARNADTPKKQAAFMKHFSDVVEHNKNILATVPKAY